MGIFDIFKKNDKKTVEVLSQKNENVNAKSAEKLFSNTIDIKKYLSTNNKEDGFINYLKDNNWKIELSVNNYNSKEINKRYKSIPESWESFIKKYDLIINVDETTWFLCLKDYDDKDASFKYNEFELISLESATDGDKERIKEFWNNNIPIIMSVKNGYEYYAINIESGKIIYGFEPEFEQSEIVADSFEEFYEKIIKGEIDL